MQEWHPQGEEEEKEELEKEEEEEDRNEKLTGRKINVTFFSVFPGQMTDADASDPSLTGCCRSCEMVGMKNKKTQMLDFSIHAR